MYYPDWEEYRMRFFEPGLDGEAGLSPFYYTSHLYYGDTADPENEDVRRNCREWQTYLGTEVKLADIDSVLYGSMQPDDFLTPLVTEGLAESFPQNTFIKKLLEPRYRAALEYLRFVKQMEFVQQAAQDPWQETSRQSRPDTTFIDFDKQTGLLRDQSLQGLVTNAADPFLQKRYAYQAIVCHRYAEADSIVLAIFDRYFSLQDTTVLLPWALIHKADCLAGQGDSLGYNLALAQAFDRCNSKKIRSISLFVTDWTEQTVQYASTDHDKAVVLTVQAMQYPGRALPFLRRIQTFDPTCQYIPMLVAREINKLENWTLTEKLTGYGARDLPEDFYDEFYTENSPPNEAALILQKQAAWNRENLLKDRAYLSEMRIWVEELIHAGAYSAQHDFLRLAAAHLNFLAGNYGKAQAFLSGISPQAQPRLQLQRDVERLLLTPYLQNVGTASVQQDLVRQLRHIWANRQYLDHPGIQFSRMHFYLCRALFRAGDIPAAGLFYNKAWLTSNEGGSEYSGYNQLEFFDAHARVADLDRLISLRKNGAKTAFERYLLEKPPAPDAKDLYTIGGEAYEWYMENDTVPAPLPTLSKLLELQGTIAFRDGDLARAKAIFAQIPADFWTDDDKVDIDIFADAAHFPFEKITAERGTKMEVVRHMLALEKESQYATGARRAEIYYQLGNGWFNCSYWGRSWYMFSYDHNYEDDDSPEVRTAGNFPATPDVRKYGGTYFRFDRALNWYHKALEANPPKELAAKIAYMIADCDRYVRIMRGGTDQYYEYDQDEKLPSSPLFKQWAAQYGRTATFTERMAHCPELKDYLGR